MRDSIASEGITPLEYLISVMRDVSCDQAKRIEAAKSAAPYVHARLSAVDFTGTLSTTHEQFLEQIDRDAAQAEG